MTTTNEKAPAATGADESTDQCKPEPKPTKKRHVLEALAALKRFHRFDAERELHDHCLPTTISEIQRDYQISVARKIVPVPGFNGSTAYPALYWLEADQVIKARKFLGWPI